MNKRWIRLEDNNITHIAYLNEDTPDLLNKVNHGNWINVGDFDFPNPNYDLVQEGGSYDEENDICRPPKPFDSWIAVGNNWETPVAPPNNDATGLEWNEAQQAWLS